MLLLHPVRNVLAFTRAADHHLSWLALPRNKGSGSERRTSDCTVIVSAFRGHSLGTSQLSARSLHQGHHHHPLPPWSKQTPLETTMPTSRWPRMPARTRFAKPSARWRCRTTLIGTLGVKPSSSPSFKKFRLHTKYYVTRHSEPSTTRTGGSSAV